MDYNSKPFTQQECLGLVTDYVWGRLKRGGTVTDEDMINQQIYLNELGKSASIKYKGPYSNSLYKEMQAYTEPGALYFDENLNKEVAVRELENILKLLEKGRKNRDGKTAAYCTYTLKKLKEALND